MVSADEAQDMLDGETRGVHACSLSDAARVGRDILSNAVVYGSVPPALHRACDMLDDVERLARTVIAQAEVIAGRATPPPDEARERELINALDDRISLSDEVERLRAIIKGRAVPPTPEERAVQEAVGGAWLYCSSWDGHALVEHWLALDSSRRPCPWPTEDQ